MAYVSEKLLETKTNKWSSSQSRATMSANECNVNPETAVYGYIFDREHM